MRVATFLLLFFVMVCPFHDIYGQALSSQKKVVLLMGSRFEITVVASNDTIAWEAINNGIAEIERIERLISSWDKKSSTSSVNRNAGIKPIKVDKELYDLIYRCKKVSQLTQGAFDISFASMDRIWQFDGSMKQLPTESAIKKAKQHINWQNIELDKEMQTVFLKEKGMKIGFGAIGKGYAANRAKAIIENTKGVEGGLVNASGDLISWGKSSLADGWTIKIADPKDKNKVLGWLQIEEMAVVTSGNYERYIELDGKRYAHIIDPRSGYPTTGIKSVTIVCADAEVADALATSVFVLGTTEGLRLVSQLKGIECLIITDADEVLHSKNLQLNSY